MSNFVSYANATELMQAISNKIAEIPSGLIQRGSVTFANLPSIVTAGMLNYCYNVSNDFTTDNRFIEGSGKKFSAGTNVVVVDDSTYDTATGGTGNPKTDGWYELVDGKYVLSDDETVDSGKNYYEKTEAYSFDTYGNFINVDGIYTDIESLIADTFSTSTAYSSGDVVIYENGLYKFTEDHAIGAWNASEVTATTVLELIKAAEPDSLTTAQVNALIALLD